jgi:RNA polymerase sigma-70 factor (ECF subfamily)
LLERIRASDRQAWERFVRLYSPLIYLWCRRAGLQESDAFDVGQNVFLTVSQNIGTYRHDRPGDSFRGWLRIITYNKLRDFARRQEKEAQGVGGSEGQNWFKLIEQAEAASSTAESQLSDRLLVFRRAVEMVLAEVEKKKGMAFWRVVVQGQSVEHVAKDLALSPNTIYLVKSRVLHRLRKEFNGCIDE